jgi:hypothetical protein
MNVPTSCKFCHAATVGSFPTIMGQVAVFACGTRSVKGEPRTPACYESEIAWHRGRVDVAFDSLRDALVEAGEDESVPVTVLHDLTRKLATHRRSRVQL